MADFTTLLRPSTLNEISGQQHLVKDGAPFRVLIENFSLGHSFFFGPAGVGKTTLARVIATSLGLPFYERNATDLKVDDLRKIFKQYQNALEKPLIFIDEIHRLAKNQQEVLLPIMEQNSALIIGASTENPFFSLTSAMRSRAMLFELFALEANDLELLLDRALESTSLTLDSDAREYLIHSSGGDARAMLKLLEFASNVNKKIDEKLLRSLRPTSLNDGSSEKTVHYDLASALIKSIRGSDLDASVYYLARLIEGGENPEFIARRLVILASEDVGNANPQALSLATSTMMAVSRIGYPEARIILSQCVIYLASSPKSNSAYNAINSAQHAVQNGTLLKVPEHISQHNKGKGYLYPHDYGGWVEQEYLKNPLKFVELRPIGFEQKLISWLEQIKQKNI